ncbi:ABC transporter ATP-binding protein [Heyndrickxia coagulans]|uniref:ABC transporter ATP-binding protein n=2 Tax=Heyndrickxia TaxID=2837504 RepID=UPI001F1EC52E|nr:ABC transporter ATP-binding protein [Heyndrickxia coagulans]UJZ88025.1 ABC transporter ATP-binding protein [Heyndrickxia coagulans]
MKPILEARNVSKVYGSGRTQVTALDNVSLQLNAGECVILMGTSGSGKSTLLNILGLMSKPTKGHILIQGKEVPERDRNRSRLRNAYFGYIHQDYAIIENETVESNVMIPLQYASPLPGRLERKSKVLRALEDVGMEWALKKQPSELSGGERQRVAIARALVNNPVVILADEPTAALDSETAESVMMLILSFKEKGATVLVATHDDKVAKLGDRILRINDGRLITSSEMAKS